MQEKNNGVLFTVWSNNVNGKVNRKQLKNNKQWRSQNYLQAAL